MGKSDDNKKELQNCFGQVLRHARNNVGLSQEKLAFATGLDRTYISLLERGLRTPSLYTLMLISKHLDISVSSMVADVEAIYKVSQVTSNFNMSYQLIVPDWENLSNYDYLSDVSDGSTWAWEFLRRNEKYQNEYFRSISLPEFKDLNTNRDSTEIFKGFRFEPKPIEATTYSEYLAEAKLMINNEYDSTELIYAKELEEKLKSKNSLKLKIVPDSMKKSEYRKSLLKRHGPLCAIDCKKDDILDMFGLDSLDDLQSPFSTTPPVFTHIYPDIIDTSLNRLQRNGVGKISVDIEKGDIIAVFTLTPDLPRQIAKAKSELIRLKKEKDLDKDSRDGSRSIKTLKESLRVLDADLSGLSVKKITAILEESENHKFDDPNKMLRQVRSRLKVAKAYMNSHYKKLLGKSFK